MPRIAYSLSTLRDQVNVQAPKRNKASDGWLGDAAHRATASDHNPNTAGVVCALDLTHDPANGFDAEKFVQTQRRNPHPNLKYMVWRGQIYSRIRNWQPAKNTGHFNHVHISVGVGPDGRSAQPYDNRTPWDLGVSTPAIPQKDEVRMLTRFQEIKTRIKLDANGNGNWERPTSLGAGTRLINVVPALHFPANNDIGNINFIGAGDNGKADGGVSWQAKGGKPNIELDVYLYVANS